MKEPVDHILRPQLPWRTGQPGITECGLNAETAPTLTREAFLQRLKDLGQQRTAMLTCMTCLNTAQRHGTWDDDPRPAIYREIEWEGSRWRGRDEHGCRIRDELLALAALAEKYRDEFDAHVAMTEQRRAWNEKKAESATKSKLRPVGGL